MTPRRDPARRLAGPLDWAIARRFLAGHAAGLVGSTARVALAASILGVAAMGVAMALMTGYRGELERKLVGGSAAIQVFPPIHVAGEPEEGDLPQRIAALPGVRGVEAVTYIQGILSSGSGEAEVTLRGVDQGGGLLRATPDQLAADAAGIPGVVLGSELAAGLGAGTGDRLRLVVLAIGDRGPTFVYRTVRVTGSFASGFSEFDRAWGVVSRPALAALSPRALSSYEVGLDDPQRAPSIAEAIREIAPPDVLVTDWRDNNRELFSALRAQQVALFLLLGLIVLVSTFNVASSLVVLIRERQRDLGALAALGLPPRRLQRIFLLYGGALGTVGTAIGLAVAAIVAWVLDRFEVIRFGPDVASIYFLRAVPFRFSLADAGAIGLFAVAVTFLSCWLPSRRALRLDPASALRYE